MSFLTTMFEKRFRIVSNSSEYLSADILAQALLDYFTQASNRPDVSFGVIEEKGGLCNTAGSETKAASA